MARMSGNDPFRCVEEVIYQLDAARTQAGIKPAALYRSIEELEAKAQPSIEALTLEYASEGARLQRAHERRIWNAVAEFWRHLGAAYEDCFWQFQSGEGGSEGLKEAIPVIVSRAIRALGAELKWTKMAYGPADPTLWGRMGALYVIAEQTNRSREPCLISTHSDEESSIHDEYLRVLMFSMAAVDTLTPQRIELVHRLSASFVHAFLMQTQPGKGCHYYVDLSAARPPARLVDRLLSPAPNPRYYGPGQAGAQTEKLIDLIESRNEVPVDLGLGNAYEPAAVAGALRHLARQWASIPPARGEEREESSARLRIVHDFDTVLKAVLALGRNPQIEASMETWTVQNTSVHGLGAVLPETPQDWLRVGTLIATRPEGGASWGVGVIRRITMNPNRQRYVGIQMMSQSTTPVRLFAADASEETENQGEVALLLPSNGEDSAGRSELDLLLRPGSFFAHRPVLMEFHQRTYPLMPKQVVEAGRDFEMVRFRVEQR
ncbi:MAG: hypothetical protein ACKVQA_14835 [Burkholderiales bacterium]